MSRIDFIKGYNHADETIGKPFRGETVDCAEVAKRLIEGAKMRMNDGINVDYQRGVIERAKRGVK